MLRMITLAILAIAPMAVVFPLVTLAQEGRNKETMQNEATKQFSAFLAQDWKRWMEDYPEMATAVGYPGQNRRWSDNSPAGVAARAAAWDAARAAAGAKLSPTTAMLQKSALDLVKRMIEAK